MLLTTAIAEFVRHCVIDRQLSKHTVQAYAFDLADLESSLARDMPLAEITTDTLKIYLENITVRRKRAPATVRRRIACFRSFFYYCRDRGLVPDPFAGWRLKLPRPKRLPRALSRNETLKLLSTLAGRQSTHRNQEEITLRTVIRLAISTGLRVGELCQIRVEDISGDGATIKVHGKGSRDRIAYVADPTFRQELCELSALRRLQAGVGAPLFVNRHGSKMTPRSIRAKLGQLAHLAGLARRITPHMLRHTAATLLLETGVDIRIIQRLLGHASIATTELYTHVSDETLKATLERANVLRSLNPG